MSNIVPSPEQQQVIDHEKGSLLVAAAAGSGKTTTLISHVLARLQDKTKPGDLRRMIIVTYTNAAASEMRAKLIRELGDALAEDQDNARLKLQSEIAPQAHICTVDSFCGFLVRNYFDKLDDVSPDIRIADKSELALLKDDVLDALMEEEYETADIPDFIRLITDYSSEKGDADVRTLVKKLYDTAQNALFPEDWLTEAGKPQPDNEEDFWKQDWVRESEQDLREGLNVILGMILALKEKVRQSEAPRQSEYLQSADGDESFIRDLLKKDFTGMQRRLSEKAGWQRKPSKKENSDTLEDQMLDEEFDLKKKEYKGLYDDLKEIFGRVPERQFALVRMSEKPRKALIELTKEFGKRFKKEMKRRNIADFIDIEHYALQLLIEKEGAGIRRTPLAAQLASEFNEIIVDEYQDINNVQDALLRALSGEDEGRPNLFMVGDVKQSIYRFRRANPGIFMEKYRNFDEEKDAPHRKIDLSTNYRSRKEIVEGVNDLFRRIMDEPFGGIAYDGKAQLNFGATYFNGEGHVPEVLLTECGGPVEEGRAADAARIGRKILELKEKGTLNNGKQISFGSVQILMRAMTDARIYVETLGEMGIPAVAPLRHGFYETEEVQTVLALLKTIDNPRQDIPLASVLTSPLVGFSDSFLADVTAYAKQEAPEAKGLYGRLLAARDKAPERFGRVVAFLEQLERWRDMAEIVSIPELIRTLMTESGYELYLRAMPGGMTRLANLETLLDKAEAYENTSYRGLFQFNRYMDRLIERIRDTDEGESAPVQDDDDVVHIDTIHSSKGLQYPIVFVADASRSFIPRQMNKTVLVHEKEGVAMQSRDPETREKTDDLRKAFILKKIRDEIGEEQLRLLYVAMTRAEEYLYVTGAVKADWRDRYSSLKDLPDGPLPSYAVRSGSSYLDWILMAAAAGMPHVRIVPETAEDPAEHEERSLKSSLSWEELRRRMETVRNDPPEIPGELDKRVHFRYPYEALAGVRGLYTVSALKKAAEEAALSGAEEDMTEEVPGLRAKAAKPEEKNTGRKPGEGISGAERGTVFHKIMEHLVIANAADEAGAAAEIARMKAEGRLSDEEAAAVSAAEIFAFFRTPLGERVRRADAAGKLFREQPFILGMPLGEVIGGHEGSRETVLIQGIIDLYFEEDGKLILADYKTDRGADGEELVSRYRLQLDYYRKALEQASGKTVSETYIYSTVMKQAVPVGRAEN